MAKYLGAEAGFKACERAVLTHGGMGYAQEYHVERLFREVQIGRLAPVSQQLISNYISQSAFSDCRDRIKVVRSALRMLAIEDKGAST